MKHIYQRGIHNLHRTSYTCTHSGLFNNITTFFSFLLSNFCFFIGSVSIVTQYLHGNVPTTRLGRKTSKESFWPSVNVSTNSSEYFCYFRILFCHIEFSKQLGESKYSSLCSSWILTGKGSKHFTSSCMCSSQ